MSTIINNPDNIVLVVNGFKVTDWPADGNIIEVAQGQAASTYVPGFGRAAFIFGPEWHQISITVESGSQSDNWLEASYKAFRTLRKLCEISCQREAQPLFSSVEAGITLVPPIVISPTGFPMRTWQFAAKCVGPVSAGKHVAAAALTQSEVQNYLPA